VAGHRGMVGSALVRCLEARGDRIVTRTRDELDSAARAVQFRELRCTSSGIRLRALMWPNEENLAPNTHRAHRELAVAV
jgi:nucleoside-diphosphate-sugar epimerase